MQTGWRGRSLRQLHLPAVSVGTSVAQRRRMSHLHTSACALPLVFGLACATTTPQLAAAPECSESEPTIVVSDSTAQAPVTIVPDDNELLSMRLFVVSASGEGIDQGLPESIRSSPTCTSGGCTLLLSPMLLGRSRGRMEIEVGTGEEQKLFSLEAKPRLTKQHVELELQAQFAVKADDSRPPAQRLKFEGLLEPGEITHVGTFHAEDHRGPTVGPQVFVMVERAASERS